MEVYIVSEENKKRKTERDQSFEEKFEKEKLLDNVPDEEVKKELRDEKKGRKSKNDSVTEEEYDEDLRP
ncbi:hypothetical protein EQV77_10175 [Halobacillus fulvus]|nr:hypothetical protein EQV77_10175 [Halobacillus fulvus]